MAGEGPHSFENLVIVDDRSRYSRRRFGDSGFCMVVIGNSAIGIMMVMMMVAMIMR